MSQQQYCGLLAWPLGCVKKKPVDSLGSNTFLLALSEPVLVNLRGWHASKPCSKAGCGIGEKVVFPLTERSSQGEWAKMTKQENEDLRHNLPPLGETNMILLSVSFRSCGLTAFPSSPVAALYDHGT